MKQHEREYFISRIRSGYHTLKVGGIKLKVFPPYIEDELEANTIYSETYSRCLEEGLKTEEEMIQFLMETKEWTENDQAKVDGLPKDIDRFKVEIYNHRFKDELKERARKILRAGEKQLGELLFKRSLYRENTCEGQATLAKYKYLMSVCTYYGSELYDFENVDHMELWQAYQSLILEEKYIRDLARKEPWGSIWALSKTNTYDLFRRNDGRELNIDQRNILVWSKTYDNIAQSPDSPPDFVMEDFDMLDGWFILQKQKNERERMEAQMKESDHMQNADEVFIMVDSKEAADRVEQMNSAHIKGVKKQRMETLKQKGTVHQHDFLDERIKIRNKHNQAFKEKFNG